MAVRLPDSIRSRVTYMLAKAHQRQLALFERHTAELGISAREYAVLLLLEGQDHIWQSEIADALGLDRTTVTYLVDALESRAWVARRRDPADRRAHVVTLTDAGRESLDQQVRPAARAATDELLAPLDATEQAQLRSLLARLNSDLP
ncbi:MAG: MarR family transcriptional regulator [Salinisphaera sp.]|jgi:DNA-binding MarR family transcriptional regulator|nr:MarR family transcriptional regulator [Salinisphaera sp.]